jgi:hypothetical protein
VSELVGYLFPSIALSAIIGLKHATLIIAGGASVKAEIHMLYSSKKMDLS